MSIFTVRRYAKHGICSRRVSVRFSLSVCVSVTLQYCITRSSAIANGLRDTLVSTNLATTKHPILK